MPQICNTSSLAELVWTGSLRIGNSGDILSVLRFVIEVSPEILTIQLHCGCRG